MSKIQYRRHCDAERQRGGSNPAGLLRPARRRGTRNDAGVVVVFLGPSLSLEKAKQILPDALYLPPVKCGDILDALKYYPKKIVIIDGYFENVAAVWHKEILFALDNQVEVYGASSMGALRAAELADFGMIGIGKIFNDFHRGKLEDDDEVTVVHRPVQSGYAPITDAMVNIRATLEKAVRENIITVDIADKLTEISKNMFYKKRTLNTALEIFEKKYAVFESEIQVFQIWLNTEKENFVDQKEIDAIELLEILKKNMSQHKKSSQINMSIVLQKLLDRHQCEPMNHEYHENNDDTLLRYARLLAYMMKTAEYMKNINRDINKKAREFDSFFYGLILLFDADILKDFNHQNTQYFKILQFCAGFILKVHKFMEDRKVFLNQAQKKQYLDEIILFLPNTYDASRVSHEQLIAIYFVLKDMINNSMVYFLSFEHKNNNKSLYLYTDRDYFKTAKNIILNCIPLNLPPIFDP